MMNSTIAHVPKKIKLSEATDALDSQNFKHFTLSEKDVGMSNYISSGLPGFEGIIKHRFSDFLVNEVHSNNSVVHLTDLNVPESLIPVVNEPVHINDNALGKRELGGLINDDNVMQQLESMIDSENVPPQEITSPKIQDKNTRTAIHNTVKLYFNDLLTTSTNNDGCIIFKGKIKGDRNNERTKRFDWKQTGDYCHFTLYKENKDTMECLDLLSKKLRCPTKTLTFAGTKDKRGITVQRISAYRVTADKLSNMNRSLIGIQVGNFAYEKNGLRLGDLKGNKFTVALRDVQPQNDLIINNALTSLKENGFINYYGMQRFGTFSIPTYIVGIAALKGEWEKAVDIILQHKPEDSSKVSEARTEWFEKKDAKKASNLFPRRSIAERAILNYFAKSQRTTDFLGALSAIPRNLRLLYVHAYQSLVWNNMATERIRIYGNKLAIGDLVAVKTAKVADVSLDIIESEPEILLDEEQVSSDDLSDKVVSVKLIENEQDIENFTMEDLVLPLPGTSVEYPTNKIYEEYVSFMAKDGFDPKNMHRKQKDFSLTGSYRKVVSRPKNMSWKLIRYNDSTISLTRTDLDKLNNSPEIESIDDGESLAVVIDFTLNSSTYATMALREVLKSETSASHQSNLSKQSHAVKSSEPTDDVISTL